MSLLSPALEAFIAVAQAKTVHGAASHLHITQTAVTQRIHNLEAKLKTTLFIRTRRGMMLTSEGEALLRYCNAASELEGEALAKISGAAIETTLSLTITGPTSIMSSRIIPQCVPILKKFPNLLMRFDVNDVENRIQQLRAGESQFALLQPEHVAPEMEQKLLAPERYVLVCGKAWKSRKLRDIIQNERIIDFDPSDQMTFQYLKKFDLLDIANHERYFVNRPESIAMMIAKGLGYGILTAEFSKNYVAQHELIVLNQGKIFENHLALCWFLRPEPPKYFSALINGIS